MASELGQLIREQRTNLEIGVRELARRVELSATMIVKLEQEDSPPSISEEKLSRIALELGLEADEVVFLGGKIPADVRPETVEEIELFHVVKSLPEDERKRLLASNDE